MKDKKTIGPSFPNAAEIVRVVYDFAVDGGAIGALDAIEATDTCVVSMKHAHVISAVTSDGAVEFSIGSEANTNEFLNAEVKADLAENDVLSSVGSKVRLVSGDKIQLDIAVAAITAGKVEFVFEVVKSN